MMNLINNRNYISTDALYYGSSLSHHGIKGQKWGVRRYQNEDGSYKSGAEGRYNGGSSGKKSGRYQNSDGSLNEKGQKRLAKDLKKLNKYQSRVSDNVSKRQRRNRLIRDIASASGKSKLLVAGRNMAIRRNRINMRRANKAYKRIQTKYGREGIKSLSQDQITKGDNIAKQYRREKMSFILERSAGINTKTISGTG